MILEIGSALLPAPITIDTDAPPGLAAEVLRPTVIVRMAPGGAVVASYAPAGAAPSGGAAPFVALAVVVTVTAFAVIGVVKSV